MSKAYVIDKNMGHKMDVPVGFMPTHNADGRAVVPLTEEQKYLFDARGWLFIPGILNKVEVEEMRAYALRLHDNPASLPEHGRSFVAGSPREAHRPSRGGWLSQQIPRLSSSFQPRLLRLSHGQ